MYCMLYVQVHFSDNFGINLLFNAVKEVLVFELGRYMSANSIPWFFCPITTKMTLAPNDIVTTRGYFFCFIFVQCDEV